MNRPAQKLACPAGETPEHYALKLVAAAWLWRRGYRVIGTELEVGAFRVDVAGAVPLDLRGTRVAVVEAKATRADFLRDHNHDREIARARARLPELRAEADRLVMASATREEVKRAWRRMAEAHATLRHRRVDGTDVAPASKLTCADLQRRTTERYVIAAEGVLVPEELPDGWGLLSPAGAVLRRAADPGAPEWVMPAAFSLAEQMARRMTYSLVDALPGWKNRAPHPGLDELLGQLKDGSS